MEAILSETIKPKEPGSKEKEDKFKLQTFVTHKLSAMPVTYQLEQTAKDLLFDINKQAIS